MTRRPTSTQEAVGYQVLGSRLELFTTKITKNTKNTIINLVSFVSLWLILPHFRNLQFAFFNRIFAIPPILRPPCLCG
jgi:hypothetical protein